MKPKEAIGAMKVNHEYKFVATLVPPMLALADIEKGLLHAQIGYGLGLVEGNGSKRSPFKPKDPTNFRAGRLIIDEKEAVHFSNLATQFPEYQMNDVELQSLFNVADISFL
ncbi:hypothetical protein M1328_00470 [Patescibacteria group bacterium]|nr:hypothetical protein [Patescibacteria group bacterium]